MENRWRKCPSVFRGLKKSLQRLDPLEEFFNVLGVSQYFLLHRRKLDRETVK
jgi:hypothetical protein